MCDVHICDCIICPGMPVRDREALMSEGVEHKIDEKWAEGDSY